MNLLVIEILGSASYFTQKILLILGKRLGWFFGVLGAAAFAIVTLHKQSYAYAILEITTGILSLFGLFLWQNSHKVTQQVTLIMSFIAILGIVVVFYLNLGSPNWLLESGMIALFAIGSVFLVLRNPIGWLLYLLGHLVLIFYAYILGTYVILTLQVISIPFAFIGYQRFKTSTWKL